MSSVYTSQKHHNFVAEPMREATSHSDKSNSEWCSNTAGRPRHVNIVQCSHGHRKLTLTLHGFPACTVHLESCRCSKSSTTAEMADRGAHRTDNLLLMYVSNCWVERRRLVPNLWRYEYTAAGRGRTGKVSRSADVSRRPEIPRYNKIVAVVCGNANNKHQLDLLTKLQAAVTATMQPSKTA